MYRISEKLSELMITAFHEYRVTLLEAKALQ
jgi:hypothetical protein